MVLVPLALLLGACGTQDKSDQRGYQDAERLLDVVSQDYSGRPFLENPEVDYVKCVVAEVGRQHTPKEAERLPRLEWDVVKATAYLACQGEIVWDADAHNRPDEVFRRH
jgi:hypothetical protein